MILMITYERTKEIVQKGLDSIVPLVSKQVGLV